MSLFYFRKAVWGEINGVESCGLLATATVLAAWLVEHIFFHPAGVNFKCDLTP